MCCCFVALVKMKQLIVFELIQCQFYSTSALLAVQTTVIARALLSICLFVCPPYSGVLSRRMKIQLCGFQHLVGKSF